MRKRYIPTPVLRPLRRHKPKEFFCRAQRRSLVFTYRCTNERNHPGLHYDMFYDRHWMD